MRHVLLTTFLLSACAGEVTSPGGGDDMPEPVECEPTRSYVGFGGNKLEADRPTIEPGSDRMRMKPFAALAAEYARALALSAVDTSQYAATFGRPPARWYTEAEASANTVYAAFALAYGACTQHTSTGGSFAMAPEPTLADRLCRDFARAAWQREPADDEIAACVTYAVEKTDPTHAPAKRWAYACASVLTASSFLAY